VRAGRHDLAQEKGPPAGSPFFVLRLSNSLCGWLPRANLGLYDGAGQAEKELPQPQVWVALGFLKTNPRPITSSLKSISVPLRYR